MTRDNAKIATDIGKGSGTAVKLRNMKIHFTPLSKSAKTGRIAAKNACKLVSQATGLPGYLLASVLRFKFTYDLTCDL
jgi:hypothetical protein